MAIGLLGAGWTLGISVGVTIQRVVPLHRHGRVFGFAQSIDSVATPVSSFLIGPLAQF